MHSSITGSRLPSSACSKSQVNPGGGADRPSDVLHRFVRALLWQRMNEAQRREQTTNKTKKNKKTIGASLEAPFSADDRSHELICEWPEPILDRWSKLRKVDEVRAGRVQFAVYANSYEREAKSSIGIAKVSGSG